MRPAPPHIQAILDELEAVTQTADDKWMARCPAHNDGRPSLSIGIGEEQKCLLNCFAGCYNGTIVRRIGKTLADLFPANSPRRDQFRGRKQGRIVATYDYQDASGELLFQVVRMDPKDFRQRRPARDAEGNVTDQWVWGIEGVDRVLYRLPELLAADQAETVYVAEGEKDVEALVGIGLVATCNPGGAGKWNKLADDSALNGRRVVIVADADTAGRNHAADVAGRLYGRAASLRVIELPGAKDAEAWVSAGGTVERLIELADAAPPYEPGATVQRTKIVMTAEHLRDLTSTCVTALQDANDPPVTFVRSGALARIIPNEDDVPHIETYDKARMRARLCEVADFYVLRAKGKGENVEYEEVISDPKLALIENVLAQGNWDLPPLVGITRAPILRPDGTICAVPGYDAATKLYYYPQAGMQLGKIIENPTTEDVDVAVDKLMEIIQDFPFDSDASKANAMALLFTLLMRPAIKGQVPLCVADAPVQGTGKSLLVQALAMIVLGQVSGDALPSRDDEDEWRKRITGLLMQGRSFIMLDNVSDGTSIGSPALAAALTSQEWSDRRLGSSEVVTLPSRAVWACTGNNLRIEGDMTRRCYLVRLDSGTERPWARDGFKIADLEEYVRENRADLLAAAFTIVRGWYAGGCRRVPVPKIGGFDNWANTIGGVLDYAGIPGFLENMQQVVEVRDEETQQWVRFVEAWWYEYRDAIVTTHDICDRLCSNPATNPHEPTIPDALLVARDKGSGYLRRSLGRHLSKYAGRVYGGHRIVDCGIDKKRKVRAWQLSALEVSGVSGVKS